MPKPSRSAAVRRAAASLRPLDYAATLLLVAVFPVGTRPAAGPKPSHDYYRSAATVIPSLLIAVAVSGRFLELARKPTFRHQYRTVLLAIVVFGGETGALMTIARDKTNWAAHLYV